MHQSEGPALSAYVMRHAAQFERREGAEVEAEVEEGV